ncbi:MAG: MFS transporter [Acidobacteriota bacterium]
MSDRAPDSPTRLLNVNFLTLWSGQVVSQVGDQAFLVVMMFWIKEATGSASVVGLLMMLSSLPALLVGPFAGALADRHSRRQILLVADLARGLDLILLSAVLFLWHGPKSWLVLLFFVVAVFNSVVNAAFAPAISATIPDLVPKARIAGAASFNQVSSRLVVFVGQAGAGSLYRILGAPVLCALDGITFLVSAFSVTLTKFPVPSLRAPAASAQVLRNYLEATREGLRYVRSRPGMWKYLWTSASLNFFFMPIFVLLPFYVEETLSARIDFYGYLMAAFAIGGLLGSALPGALGLTGRRRGLVTIACLLATSLLFVLLGWLQSVPGAIVVLFGVGVTSGLVNVTVITLFQASTPSELRGRVMSLLIAMSRAVSPLGMAAGGVLGDLSHGGIPKIYILCGLASLLVSLSMTASTSFREFLTWQEH